MTKIVTIGGGTGSFVLLRGLKKYPFSITAIVNTFDSGGSSGILRDEYGILPPGDIRRCLVALSDEKDESTLRDLFNFRFEKDGALKGHNFGNIFLTALTQMSPDYSEAINRAAKILNCQGEVYPVSLDKSNLFAELEDGQIIKGETNIDIPRHDPFLKIDKIFLNPKAYINPSAKRALLEADVIVFCPGDIYTSVIPNLLVKGVSEAIRQSQARKIYICNLMTKPGETNGFKASQFIREILAYSGLDQIDYLICNNKPINQGILKKYAEENKYPVEIDAEVSTYAKHVILDDVYSEADILHHDLHKVGRIIEAIVNKVFVFDLDDTLFDSSDAKVDEPDFPIKPFDGVQEILSTMRGRAILVTRGSLEIQKCKIEKLGIGRYFDEIHICPTDDGKLNVFKEIIKKYSKKEIIVVGNRIDCEIRYGKMLGLKTIHLQHGKYARLRPKDTFEIADVVIHHFLQINSYLT